MSIRILFCVLFVIVFSIYAWRRDWFISLCAALILMAVVEHPDMPSSIAGIQGLNLWNLLILNIVGAWWQSRRQQALPLGIPRTILVFGILYLGVIFFGFIRLVLNPAHIVGHSFMSATSEYLINAIKWVVPGFLLIDGCRTEKRIRIAMFCLLAVYVLLAVQVIRWMPLEYITSGDRLSARASKIIQNEIGYNRVTLSMMLAGASWAILATLPLIKKTIYKLFIVGCAVAVMLGQALTGGRTGYLAWGAVGLILCLAKWRRMLPLIPTAALLIATLVPAVRERMLSGIGGQEGMVVAEHNDYEMTSGRTLIWPYVIEKIKDAPIIGYGKLAMIRTGLSKFLADEHNELFAHPHNAYMEVLLDNGVVGFVIIIPFYLLLLKRGFNLFQRRDDPYANAAGGAACALLLALLIGSFGGQTFYPREGAVAMWAVFGIVLRISADRRQQVEEAELVSEMPDNLSSPSWA
jgi:O-antigen ligase